MKMDYLWKQTMKSVKRQNKMEDDLAMERYGVKFDDLDEDEKGEIAMDVVDLLNR